MQMIDASALAGIHAATLLAALQPRALFGLSEVNASANEVADALLRDSEKRRVSFVNTHCIKFMQHDPRYRAALLTADHKLTDGISVALAARMNCVFRRSPPT